MPYSPSSSSNLSPMNPEKFSSQPTNQLVLDPPPQFFQKKHKTSCGNFTSCLQAPSLIPITRPAFQSDSRCSSQRNRHRAEALHGTGSPRDGAAGRPLHSLCRGVPAPRDPRVEAPPPEPAPRGGRCIPHHVGCLRRRARFLDFPHRTRLLFVSQSAQPAAVVPYRRLRIGLRLQGVGDLPLLASDKNSTFPRLLPQLSSEGMEGEVGKRAPECILMPAYRHYHTSQQQPDGKQRRMELATSVEAPQLHMSGLATLLADGIYRDLLKLNGIAINLQFASVTWCPIEVPTFVEPWRWIRAILLAEEGDPRLLIMALTLRLSQAQWIFVTWLSPLLELLKTTNLVWMAIIAVVLPEFQATCEQRLQWSPMEATVRGCIREYNLQEALSTIGHWRQPMRRPWRHESHQMELPRHG